MDHVTITLATSIYIKGDLIITDADRLAIRASDTIPSGLAFDLQIGVTVIDLNVL